MAKVSFMLHGKGDTASVYVRLSVKQGITPKRSIGKSCHPDHWKEINTGRERKNKDKASQWKVGEPRREFEYPRNLHNLLIQGIFDDHGNIKKAALKTVIQNKYEEDSQKGDITFNGQWLQDIIDLHFGYKKPEHLEYLTNFISKYNSTKLLTKKRKVSQDRYTPITKTTIIKYNNALTKIKEFEAFKGKQYLTAEITNEFKDNFEDFLKNHPTQKLSYNTIGRIIKYLRTFLLLAEDKGYRLHKEIKEIKGYSEEIKNIYLTPGEIEQIKGAELPKGPLDHARDWLIIACYTAQRASDLLRMEKGMIERIKGHRFIIIKNLKTHKRIQIPLHREVLAVLKKYNGEFPPTFSSNPGSNTAMFNQYLKQVCKAASINTITQGTVRDPKTSSRKPGKYPKWMLVSSHIGRRSFCTNMYANKEYPTPIIMSVSGHSTEQQFLTYIQRDKNDRSIDLAEIWSGGDNARSDLKEKMYQALCTYQDDDEGLLKVINKLKAEYADILENEVPANKPSKSKLQVVNQ